MKKIGIMSMQRIINYGSYLQAYGLKKTIEELGHKVEFVDYEYEKPLYIEYKKRWYRKIFDNIDIINFIKRKKCSNKFKLAYEGYLKELSINNSKNIRPEIDTLVIGSDEVFNCMQGYPVGYSRELFGKNYESKNVISYAASFGHTKLENLKEHNIDKEIGQMLNRFKAISVRDENSYKIVESITNKTPLYHLDPALIANFEDVNTNICNFENFIIVYAYTNRLTPTEEKYIKKFAKKNNKKIISLGFFQRIADYNLVVSPFELLEFFKKADYIITDTFHGSIFSIKMNSKFCTIIRDSNRNKLTHLLNVLKQGDRVVENLTDIDKLYEKEIDYIKTNKVIEEESNKTREYLKFIIG